jgi:hypothetical protein
MLEAHHGSALERIRRWSDRVSGNAEAMVKVLFAELAIWASKPRWSERRFTPSWSSWPICRPSCARYRSATQGGHRVMAHRGAGAPARCRRRAARTPDRAALEGCQVLMLTTATGAMPSGRAGRQCDWVAR